MKDIIRPSDVKDFALSALRALRAPRPGKRHVVPRKRVIDVADIAQAIGRHERALRSLRGKPATVRTVVRGGYVAGAYKYPARADKFEIRTDVDGFTQWYCTREYAQRRPHGRGERLITRVILPGQRDGRIFNP